MFILLPFAFLKGGSYLCALLSVPQPVLFLFTSPSPPVCLKCFSRSLHMPPISSEGFMVQNFASRSTYRDALSGSLLPPPKTQSPRLLPCLILHCSYPFPKLCLCPSILHLLAAPLLPSPRAHFLLLGITTQASS